MLVRFRVECRDRVELHEVQRQDIVIGRDATCDLAIDHATIAARHARILVRRNRMILADVGRTRAGTTRGRERVTAPVTLDKGGLFRLGDVDFSAVLAEDTDRSLAGDRVPEGEITAELESPDRAVRRYRVRLSDGGDGELAILDRSASETSGRAWLDHVERSATSSPHLPTLLGTGRLLGRPYFVEGVSKGLRFSTLLDRIGRGTLQLPLEASIAAIALVSESVAAMNLAWGPHGAIDPRRVQLGLDGSVLLLRPGPFVALHGATLDEYVAPERRVAFEPSVAGDAFALGVLGKSILQHRADCPTRIRAICYWLAHVDASRRPQDLGELARELRRAAQTAGLDPTFGHVARVARLLSPTRNRPLCTVSRPTVEMLV